MELDGGAGTPDDESQRAHPWRDDPRLRDRFHPKYPDDLQVVVHDGNPRRSGHVPELMWVRVTDAQADHFVGICLNDPHAISSVTVGEPLRFRVSDASDHPFQVSPEYLADRESWVVARPCNECGFDELFDPPSVLAARFASDAGEGGVVEVFTEFCPLCGGVQVVVSRSALEADARQNEQPDFARQRRSRWRFGRPR